jgi:diacylglycerol kinase (ATP)
VCSKYADVEDAEGITLKNQTFGMRLGFALAGVRFAFARERSFRTHVFLGAGALVALIALRPTPLWWALCLISGSAVYAAELFNTALEQILDRLHPEKHESIRAAKDCAAAAVLCFSLVAVGVGILTLLATLGWLK